jgi:hypothetical protein
VFAEIDLKGRFLSYDKLNDEIDNYQLSIFSEVGASSKPGAIQRPPRQELQPGKP